MTMTNNLEKRKSRLEEEIYAIEEAQEAIGELETLNNKYVDEFMSELGNKLDVTKRQLRYVKQELESPWLEESGRINKGEYEGFYIVPLLKALAWSAKDFPTAMRMIGEAANDQTMIEGEYTMYPSDYKMDHPHTYLYLRKLAPNANWDLVKDIQWDT